MTMQNNYLLYTCDGMAKALLSPTIVGRIVADGHGSWVQVVDGVVGYVMKSSRQYSMGTLGHRVCIYLQKGDYIRETDEPFQ